MDSNRYWLPLSNSKQKVNVSLLEVVYGGGGDAGLTKAVPVCFFSRHGGNMTWSCCMLFPSVLLDFELPLISIQTTIFLIISFFMVSWNSTLLFLWLKNKISFIHIIHCHFWMCFISVNYYWVCNVVENREQTNQHSLSINFFFLVIKIKTKSSGLFITKTVNLFIFNISYCGPFPFSGRVLSSFGFVSYYCYGWSDDDIIYPSSLWDLPLFWNLNEQLQERYLSLIMFHAWALLSVCLLLIFPIAPKWFLSAVIYVTNCMCT